MAQKEEGCLDSELNWIETFLIKENYLQTHGLIEISQIKQVELASTNTNNGSCLRKFQILCKTKSGTEQTRHVILKSKRLETGPNDVTEILGAFPVEIKLYGDVLQHINELLDLKKLRKPWPEYYGSKGTNILLEDLSDGYKMKLDRKMDYDHARISIKELGKFHAMTMIVVEKGSVDPTWFKPYVYARHIDFIMDLNKSAFNGLINSMRIHWEPEWQETANKIVKLTENIGDTLAKLWHSTKGKFDVINHGEYWLNNLIFKYDNSGKVADMKILDFQVSHYNSPCWDLAIFLFGSLSPNLRNEFKEKLLKIYYDEFLNILNLYEYKCEIPKISYIKEELENIWFFCFLASVTAPPWMLSLAKEGIHHEDDTADKDILSSFHMPCYQWQVVRDTMKKEVEYWVSKGKF